VYDDNTKAILLLSSYFSKVKKDEYKPLTVIEYGRFALWLHENGYSPASLFQQLDEIADSWHGSKGSITKERLKALLGRGVAMSLALEKWQRAGVWLITRMDEEYPKELKKRLGHNSPAFFYGVGNKHLLKSGGLAVIGSRGISSEDEKYTSDIGKQAASEGLNIVSGGARGVDETAMLSALSASGTAIGVMADSLLKASTSSKWRQYLQSENLVLISSFYPEAGFNAGNAMARNKYIYCLSEYALSVRSDEGKGGTWTGAKENLQKHWAPLFVKPESEASGNRALMAMGASPLNLPVDHVDSSSWLTGLLETGLVMASKQDRQASMDLFANKDSGKSD